jgi:RNA polymerase sigma-70 factor (ECF subfamily)
MSSSPQERALVFPVVGTEELKRATAPTPALVSPPSHEELMTRLQGKDSSALDVIFDNYSRLVLGIALRILHDYGEAEEVVQETFFYLYQKANRFDASKGTLKAWIGQIAFHRALDRKAHLARRGFYVGTDIASLDDTLLGKTDVEREIASELDRSQLEKAFEELPEMQRRTLDLFYFEGLDLREISARLNEPWENVRHHFYRGLERLRKSAFVRRLGERR